MVEMNQVILFICFSFLIWKIWPCLSHDGRHVFRLKANQVHVTYYANSSREEITFYITPGTTGNLVQS